jgi:2-polyprenyl-3-methyl-5-hydroxy-6-metoxy-1,4-benzoquinol methylase
LEAAKMINQEKFADAVAETYSRERLLNNDSYIRDEWNIVEQSLFHKAKILDLCCGPGTFLVPLTKRGYNINGLDFSKKMIKKAEFNAKANSIAVRIKQINALEYIQSESYDLILFLGDGIGSFTEKKERNQLIKNCNINLKNGGRLILTCGNRNTSLKWILKQSKDYLISFFSKERLSYGNSYFEIGGVRGLHHNFSYQEIKNILKQNNFVVRSIKKTRIKFIVIAEKWKKTEN